MKKNLENIRRIVNKSSDLLENPININGVECCLVCFEGMISTSTITNLILRPLKNMNTLLDGENSTGGSVMDFVKTKMLLTIDRAFSTDYGDLIRRVMSGFAILLIDGVSEVGAFGVQGYAVRGIGEPAVTLLSARPTFGNFLPLTTI